MTYGITVHYDVEVDFIHNPDENEEEPIHPIKHQHIRKLYQEMFLEDFRLC